MLSWSSHRSQMHTDPPAAGQLFVVVDSKAAEIAAVVAEDTRDHAAVFVDMATEEAGSLPSLAPGHMLAGNLAKGVGLEGIRSLQEDVTLTIPATLHNPALP